MSETTIRNAFSATEEGFFSIVQQLYPINKIVASWGSCCLVGVIWEGTLYVANLGDSRAVLGSEGKKMLGRLWRSKKVTAQQLTKDHNAKMEEVRQELRTSHPDDPHIVFERNGVWRIKGIIQVCTPNPKEAYFLIFRAYYIILHFFCMADIMLSLCHDTGTNFL